MCRTLFMLITGICLFGCSAPQSLPPQKSSRADASISAPDVDITALELAADKLSLLEVPENFPTDLTTSEPNEELDPVTLADNLMLLGFDQTPPETEGRSIRVSAVEADFPVVDNAKVRYFVDYYTGPGRNVFNRWLGRAHRYVPQMQEIFAEAGLPLDLAYLAMVESGFNLKAYSWAHAVGPWQFIESTAKMYGLKVNWWIDERRNYIKSTKAAAAFLKDLYRRFDGNWYLAVAAYNAGGGKISRAVKKYGSHDFWEISRGKYLQPETRNYVPKLLAVLQIARHPEKYGFTDLDLLQPIPVDEVALPSTTDLEVIARLSGASYEQIKELNPELRRWSTPPGETGYLVRIPAGSRERFVAAYGELPQAERISYLRHRIGPGDTLGKLAQRHRIPLQDIIRLNRIKNPRALQIGTDLILPLSKDYSRRPLAELDDDYVRTRRRIYKVRAGDSLWSIGRRFSVSEKQLRVWNRLGWSNTIRPGQVLAVSARDARPAQRSKPRPGTQRKIIYQVKPGDTLWGIGRRYSVATSDIRSWNNLAGNHVLQPGDRLTLLVHGKGQG